MTSRAFRFTSSVFLLLLACQLCAQDVLTGKVVGVSDGDTLTLLVNQRQVKVRLHGIDAPEAHQAFGNRAKQFTSEAVFGKTVTMRLKDTDRYGRIVAEVFIDGRSLNREIVREGLAWWYRRYAPNDSMLRDLEANARQAMRGLWADPDPVPPWEFRRRRSQKD